MNDKAVAQDLAVALGFGAVVNLRLGDAFVATIGNGAAGLGSGEKVLLDLEALRLGWVFDEVYRRCDMLETGTRTPVLSP
jgi:hypothetical protein